MNNSSFVFDNRVVIQGLTGELNSIYILKAYEKFQQNILVVTSSLYEANQIFNSLETYTDKVLLFPMDDFLTSVAVAISPELKMKRLETLDKINLGEWIVVTNLTGYLRFLPDLKKKDQLKVTLSLHDNIGRDRLHEVLLQFGYKQDSLVTSTGEYAVRGFVLDIFPTYEDHPLRIEFFGSEIESIRYFDESTQLSLESIESITINPNQEIVTEHTNSLYDFLHDPIVIYKDLSQIKASNQKLEEDIFQYQVNKNEISQKYMYQFSEIFPKYEILLNTFESTDLLQNVVSFSSKEIENFKGNFNAFLEYVENMFHLKKIVVICLSKDAQIKQIADLLKDYPVQYESSEFVCGVVYLLKKKINKGFLFQDYVIISEFDLEEVRDTTIHYKNNYKIGKKINALDSLKSGDYVVHRAHGIGTYYGVVTLKQSGLMKDYIQINYAGNDKVYIPVEKISTIYKYTDKDGMKPQINKLNSTTWINKKRAIQKRIHDISEELIKLYAARNNIKGEVYKDYEEEDVFASKFLYEPTNDQKRAIQEINQNLKSPVPMDHCYVEMLVLEKQK